MDFDMIYKVVLGLCFEISTFTTGINVLYSRNNMEAGISLLFLMDHLENKWHFKCPLTPI